MAWDTPVPRPTPPQGCSGTQGSQSSAGSGLQAAQAPCSRTTRCPVSLCGKSPEELPSLRSLRCSCAAVSCAWKRAPVCQLHFMALLFTWPREPFDLIALILMFSLPFAAAIGSDRACITGLLPRAPQVMEGRGFHPSLPRRAALAQRSARRHIPLPN